MFAGAGGLDGGIEGQQVGLVGNVLDESDDAVNPSCVFVEALYLGRCVARHAGEFGQAVAQAVGDIAAIAALARVLDHFLPEGVHGGSDGGEAALGRGQCLAEGGEAGVDHLPVGTLGIVAALFTFQVMGMCPGAGQFLFKLQVGPFEFTQFSAEVVNGMAVGTVENEHDDPWAPLDGVTVITLA